MKGTTLEKAARSALALALVSLVPQVGLAQQKKKPSPTVPAAPSRETSGDEIYRLGREALARGSFETAERLFGALDGEARFEKDPAYMFNRAQACRYANQAGEAVYWFGRYLALAPSASDAPQVKEQLQKLVAASPQAVRQAVLKRLKADYDREAGEPEVAHALQEMPLVNVVVRFLRKGAPVPADTPSYVFPARAIYWQAPDSESPEATWRVWILPTTTILVPEGLGTPPLLLSPSGRAFPVEMGAELVSRPLKLSAAPVPYFPVDPEVAAWEMEVVAEVQPLGPPVFLVGARPAIQMVDARSGRDERPLSVGKKRRELPTSSVPLSFGPRVTRPDSKLFPKVPLAVVDLSGKDGAVERWAAPMAAFDVVNRFGRLVTKEGQPDRIYVRPEEAGPFLLTR